jgi:hypothetical protein
MDIKVNLIWSLLDVLKKIYYMFLFCNFINLILIIFISFIKIGYIKKLCIIGKKIK